MINLKEVTVFGRDVSVHICGEYFCEDFVYEGTFQEEELRRMVDIYYVEICERYDNEITPDDVWVEFVADVYDEEKREYFSAVFDEEGKFVRVI